MSNTGSDVQQSTWKGSPPNESLVRVGCDQLAGIVVGDTCDVVPELCPVERRQSRSRSAHEARTRQLLNVENSTTRYVVVQVCDSLQLLEVCDVSAVLVPQMQVTALARPIMQGTFVNSARRVLKAKKVSTCP